MEKRLMLTNGKGQGSWGITFKVAREEWKYNFGSQKPKEFAVGNRFGELLMKPCTFRTWKGLEEVFEAVVPWEKEETA